MTDDLAAFARLLRSPDTLVELAVLAGCLVTAWCLTRLARGPLPRPGIWFGSHVVDGVLFPALALLLAFTASWALVRVLPGAVFRLVVPVLLSLLVIRLVGRVLRRAWPASHAVLVFERSVSWLAWISVLLWITGVLPLLLAELDRITWKIGGSPVSLRNLLEGAVAAVLVMIVALWVASAVETRLVAGATVDLSLRKMAANALRALLLLIGLMFALSAAGIDLTALSVLGGALGVGIGFGLQKLASNYISGFVVLAERVVRIGDTVKVDGFEGRVVDISTRFTVLRAVSGREAYVPNEMMITQRVENLSRADPRLALVSSVVVPHGTDLGALLPRLADALAAVPRVIADPAPAVHLAAFQVHGIELQAAFHIADPANGEGNVRSAVNLTLLRVLGDAGVTLVAPSGLLETAAASSDRAAAAPAAAR